MPSTTIAQLLNRQLNLELYSAYLYFDFSNYFGNEGLDGFQHWYYVQTQEERDHAMLLRAFLLNNGAAVTLEPVAAPPGAYSGFAQPLEMSLAHEREVTASIHRIYGAAYEEKDYRTMQFLDWFVKEQGEEEKNAADQLKKYELFGGEQKGLYMLDRELGARVYAPPSLVP